ncbi:9896_t:CDS:2 [Diversispora eburnea]|uniref:DNA-directed RNA polymerase subunit n=1 Tax=Diversispora eburnea TaxID=1213867 RepID=A0A9N9CTE4_9GLOM|nr:9896_t:CDS:2 [Diversispora eburnea]
MASILFCRNCGNLLNNNGEDIIECDSCTSKHVAIEFDNVVITTRSNKKHFPSKLRLRRSRIKEFDKEESASIKEKCPKCGHEEMNYHTMQLRSADEVTNFP